MATNNIKIFDQNKANMLTDEAYNASTQRLNGVQQGIASSQLQNKTLYQVSLVAYSIGQMMQANGLNANDADAVSTFAGNLSGTIVQKILDKATTTEAKNYTVDNKFITPQTWKAAYDFMKADSAMVTAATDDSHYITPKLLKEGARQFGGAIELENGTMAKWLTVNKQIMNTCQFIEFNVFTLDNLKATVVSKSKKYYVCFLFASEEKASLILYDNKTKQILSTINSGETFNLNNTSYKIKFTDETIVSAFSENMFLASCYGYVSGRHMVLAIDFSTGSFVVKNIFNSTYTTKGYAVLIDRTHYFTNNIYSMSFKARSECEIVKYNIASNTFNNYHLSNISAYYEVFINDDDNAYYLMYDQSNTSSLYDLYIASSKFNFDPKLVFEANQREKQLGYQIRGNNLYLFYLGTVYNTFFGKVDLTKSYLSFTKLQEITGTLVYLGPIIVNDEGTAFCTSSGAIIGSGSMELSINQNAILTVRAANNSFFTTQAKVIKYKNYNPFCFALEYFVDFAYAYFGVPVAEAL